jgi:hypothetical protein
MAREKLGCSEEERRRVQEPELILSEEVNMIGAPLLTVGVRKSEQETEWREEAVESG